MKTYENPLRGGRQFRPAWSGTGALMLGALMFFGAGTGQALATPAPAGTKIGNQALATFLDANSTRQESKSNEALTVVEFVGSFTLTQDNTKSAAAGNTVPMAHTLTNYGNDKDTFQLKVADGGSSSPTMTQITIYPDPNGTGSPSGTPLCSSDPTLSPTLCAPGVNVTVAGNGGAYRFVVAYGVPGTAGSGWIGKGTVTASVPTGSSTIAAYTSTTDTDTDTINATNGAAFAVTKSISIPAVKAPGNADWPAALTKVKPSVAGSTCSTTWPITASAQCSYTVFTINYSNTGATTGAFSFKDDIPSGMTYVAKSAVWSGNGGVALAEPATAPINFTATGNSLKANVPAVAANASGSVSFVVLVNSTAKPDGSTTGNVANYGTGDCQLTNIDTCAVTPTNKPAITVDQVYAVAASSTAGTVTSDSTSPPPLPSANTAPENNLVVMPSVAANGWVRFTNYVANTGNGTDTFNMKAGASTAFPANTQFDFFKADGLTPLLDTNNDGIPDTGPLNPGAATMIIVKATIPATTPVGSGPLSVRIDAVSVGSAAVQDSVWDQVTTVTTATLVDLTNTAAGSTDANSGDAGSGPSNAPTTTATATPGVAAQFSLFVKNNDSQNSTYNLSASNSATFPGSLPSGWTVKFYPSGTSCTATTTEVTQPVAVAAGAQLGLVACVTPPATTVTTSSTQSIYFQAKSTTPASTGSIVSDIKYDAVTLNPASKKQLLLTNSQYGQTQPGGTVSYLHTLQNASSAPQACGPFNVTVTSPDAGWNYSLVTVASDGTETTLTSSVLPALAAGAELKLRVKVNAPANAPDKFINNATLTVTDTSANACGTASNVDATSVLVGNQVGMVKEQAVDALCNGIPGTFSVNTLTLKPGACVVYRITATNNGLTAVTKVWINDMVPPYTTLTATQPVNKCVASSNSTGGPVAFVNASGSVGVTCGADTILIPSTGTLTMQFGVKLDPLPANP
ncbi:hypothetical protein PSQ40_13485 [Curvibacter sp. HBC61]|uniref:DUF11 domain-containing protein n=1 Tax=Curvibacter cyanobacteriorum TaxID=3026422 RepID=A0ABT5MZU5_9BURK|nr:hypothetical protein [Curvibacter sp. HBC61]MDD0839592.1 hypothetical protein [Curvibacter sp. HBC61]